MDPARILVVEDEAIARDNLVHALSKDGHDMVPAENGSAAFRALAAGDFDLVVTDLKLPDVSGMDILERVRLDHPLTEVLVVTGFATVETAVEAMRRGAYYYLAKPFKLEELRLLVEKALERRWLRREVDRLKQQVGGGPRLVGESPAMADLRRTIEQVAPTDCNVLIQGETGTGKELVAKAIHAASRRSDKKFLAINCGAFNEELLANELFGHEREAFTGARSLKSGLLEAAHNGTFFLDEIGDLPLTMQSKLLRVLEERRFMRLGGTTEIQVDVRLLAATNKDLKQEVEEGMFRQDLYYRLNVVVLEVPPLAARAQDIPLLCAHFLNRFARSLDKDIESVSDEALDLLMGYEYPGNVRELENIVERAAVLCTGNTIQVAHLPQDLRRGAPQMERAEQDDLVSLERNEQRYLQRVLDHTQGNKTQAAAILDIDRSSLWRKLKRYGMEE